MTANTNTFPDAAEVNALIATSWQAMDYRPTVVLSLVDRAGRALLVESSRQPGEWGLVQGGIERHETDGSIESVNEAALRELDQEVGIKPEDVVLGGIVEAMKSDAPSGHDPNRGFSEGKLYVVKRALYVGDGLLTLDPKEVSQAVFATDEEREQRLAGKRAEKAALIRRALAITRQVA